MLLIELNSNSLFWKRLTRCKPILILFDLIDHLVFLIIFQFSSGWRHNLCWLLLRTTTWRKPWRKKHWSCVFCRAVSSEKPKLLRHIWGGSMETRVMIHCPISWDLTWELCYRPGDWQGWFYWRLWGAPTIYRDISKRNTGDKTAHTPYGTHRNICYNWYLQGQVLNVLPCYLRQAPPPIASQKSPHPRHHLSQPSTLISWRGDFEITNKENK